jgi:hypothetical protein
MRVILIKFRYLRPHGGESRMVGLEKDLGTDNTSGICTQERVVGSSKSGGA